MMAPGRLYPAFLAIPSRMFREVGVGPISEVAHPAIVVLAAEGETRQTPNF